MSLTLTKGRITSVQPAVKKAVIRLRRDCIAHAPGAQLGQEDELLRRYGISRPTLRQAAALVGQEQLLLVRRGPGGGYFAQRPEISSVSHMAAIFLQVQQATIAEVLLSTSTLRGELAPLAASNLNDESAAQIKAFLDAESTTLDEDYDFMRFLRAERQQNDIVGQASGNRVLHLYMQISLELAAGVSRKDDLLFDRPERFLEWRRQRNRMLTSILNKDSDIARLEAQRSGAMILRWLLQDKKKQDITGTEQLERSHVEPQSVKS